MRTAVARFDVDAYDDATTHCIAAGLIALHCSKAEAWLASIGKEIGDLFGRGDAAWRDLESDARGVACAHSATAQSQLIHCCTN